MKKRCFLVAAVVGVLSGSVITAVAAENPTGPYQKTCKSCSVNGKQNTLYCKCNTASGQPNQTSLRLPCSSTINNCNGNLTCGACK